MFCEQCYIESTLPREERSGIDRVDNSVGYEVDNCVPCCGVCNRMKRDLTKDQFIDHVHKISEMVSAISSVI